MRKMRWEKFVFYLFFLFLVCCLSVHWVNIFSTLEISYSLIQYSLTCLVFWSWSLATEVIRGATWWKFFLQTSRSFLNQNVWYQNVGKPKFRGQNCRVNPKNSNEYWMFSVFPPNVSLCWGGPTPACSSSQVIVPEWFTSASLELVKNYYIVWKKKLLATGR